MSDLILENLKKKILEIKDEVLIEQIGKVVEVQDGVAKVFGLKDVMVDELILFDENIYGMVMNIDEDLTDALILGDYKEVHEGSIVKKTGRVLQIPISDSLIGRVVDPLIRPLDGLGDLFKKSEKPKFLNLNETPPSVIEREPVNRPLFTGITAIDSMTPIGRGQRELIIGDRQTGKTQIGLDTIYAQKFEKKEDRPICIYVAIGQKMAKVKRVVDELKNLNCLSYTIIVATQSSDPSSLIWLAPLTGATIGEYFMKQGKDALVIYDDLTKHAWAYREISLLLRRPPGREAYPGDVFYLHSRLLERAAKLRKDLGNGSLTALPIIETQLGDISGYIPTNVISITDGQIYLESELFNQGVRPAINGGLSVSRVGSKAQFSGIKKVAGDLRLSLATFRELEKFLQFGQELDKETQQKIERGKRILESLKQEEYDVSSPAQEIINLFLMTTGELDAIEISNIKRFQKQFFKYLESSFENISDEIKTTRNFDSNIQKQTTKALEKFKKVFK